MSSRALTIVGLALLLLTAAPLIAAAFQATACDDVCSAACGDCASCPPPARLAVLPTVAPCFAAGLATTAISPRPPRSPARAIEHVPLAARA